MSAGVNCSLRELLSMEKKAYLVGAREDGGTANGFRERMRKEYEAEPLKFNSLVLDALMEATTKNWQQPPRKKGPDLFSIAGYQIPDHLTRYAQGFYSPADDAEDEDDETYEKVDHEFATVNDLYDDATIKMRKAAQSSAAAEAKMKTVDEARRRARGNMSAFLKDLAD